MKTIKKKAMINRIVKSVICTAAAAGIMVSTFAAAPVYAAGTIGDFANMVVLVRFKGDVQGDNSTGFNKSYSRRMRREHIGRVLSANLTESTTNSGQDRLRSICGIFPADSIWSNRCSRKRTAPVRYVI